MCLLAPSPALMNTSLRTRLEKHRAPAADTEGKNSAHRFCTLAMFISGGVRNGVKALRASSQSPGVRPTSRSGPKKSATSHHAQRTLCLVAPRGRRSHQLAHPARRSQLSAAVHVAAFQQRGLTPPSSRAPTALALAGEALHVYHRPRRPRPSLLVPAYVER